MRRVIRIAVRLSCVVVVLALFIALMTFRAVKHEPQFYRRVMQSEPSHQRIAGAELENAALSLNNRSGQAGAWQAVFTDEQINGWLASELPEKFADLLPPGVSDPRVALESGRMRVACRYESSQIQTILSLVLEIHLTPEANTLAVRISKVRAGALPLPMQNLVDQINEAARNLQWPLSWSQDEGAPVGLVTIPSEHPARRDVDVWLESLELRDGSLTVTGRTESKPRASNPPAPQDQPEENSADQR